MPKPPPKLEARDGPPALRIISLGAGVQSSVMALMAAQGSFGDVPDFAIFADTKAEPRAVYDHLDWLEEVLPFPIHRVTAGDLTADVMAGRNSTGQSFMPIPAFTLNAGDRRASITKRQCTREYKLSPILRETRRRLGLAYRERIAASVWVEQWIGISTDEITRQKPPREPYVVGRWPLIDVGMSRGDCKVWFAERYPGRTLPRSACTFCPYHSAAEWRDLRDNDPQGWEQACAVDEALRTPQMIDLMNGTMFLLRDAVPLRDAQFSPSDHGQLGLFDEECEGMCGV